jgi:hypothetical protein
MISAFPSGNRPHGPRARGVRAPHRTACFRAGARRGEDSTNRQHQARTQSLQPTRDDQWRRVVDEPAQQQAKANSATEAAQNLRGLTTLEVAAALPTYQPGMLEHGIRLHDWQTAHSDSSNHRFFG